MADVLDQLDQNEERFVHISKLYGGIMQAVGHFYAGYPGWSIDAYTILRLAKYSLHFTFDFYEYHSDEFDDSLNQGCKEFRFDLQKLPLR